MSDLFYAFVAYAIVWAAFFAYAFFLSRKERDLRAELEELRKAIAEKERGKKSASGA
ncbi:MAG: CcmD family protein [Chloroflexi bacterium]|nr:CcmD family protein [Chloroflexota bacterium]